MKKAQEQAKEAASRVSALEGELDASQKALAEAKQSASASSGSDEELKATKEALSASKKEVRGAWVVTRRV